MTIGFDNGLIHEKSDREILIILAERQKISFDKLVDLDEKVGIQNKRLDKHDVQLHRNNDRWKLLGMFFVLIVVPIFLSFLGII